MENRHIFIKFLNHLKTFQAFPLSWKKYLLPAKLLLKAGTATLEFVSN